MRRATAMAVLGAAAAATAAAPAGAATSDVQARGNAFTGGLAFAPATVDLHVGDVVRWTNTDFAVPHTATERHGLWDLGGTYGATPLNPAGFGPGAVVQRAVEAGTTHYYCRVHPTQMTGVIAVPVDLTTSLRRIRSRGAHRSRVVQDVTARWAEAAPAAGQVFDVEVRHASGDWEPLRTGTTDVQATVRAGVRGTVTAVRARLRSTADAARATDWSPEASVTSAQPR